MRKTITIMYRVLATLALSLLLSVSYNIAYADSCPKDLTYTLHTTDEQSEDPTWKISYSANSTNTIFFALDIEGKKRLINNYLSTPHTLTTFVYGPGGFPYQSFTQPITATSGDMIRCGRRYWEAVPVAGTIIQQFGLYGTWTAESFIDGVRVATTSFEITP